MSEDKTNSMQNMAAQMRNLEPWKSELWDHLSMIHIAQHSLGEAKESEPFFAKIVSVASALSEVLRSGKTFQPLIWESKIVKAMAAHHAAQDRLTEREKVMAAKAVIRRVQKIHASTSPASFRLEISDALQGMHYPCVCLERHESALKHHSKQVGSIVSSRIDEGDMGVLELSAKWWNRIVNGETTFGLKGEQPSPKPVQVLVFRNQFRLKHRRNPTNAELLDFANPILKVKGLPPLTDSDVSKAKQKAPLLKSLLADGRRKS